MRNQEITALHDALQVLGITPCLALVVVVERQHTRFLSTCREGMDRSGNLKAGTVVDRAVTYPTDFDLPGITGHLLAISLPGPR